jgi:hypothetical protein
MGKLIDGFRLAVVSLIIAGYSSPALSQSTVMFENFLPSVVETNLRNQILWEPYRSSPSERAIKATPRNEAVKFSFRPNAAQRKSNLSNFVSKVRNIDPTGASQMEQLFATTDVVAQIGAGLAPFGLRIDNIADAYTAYWMSAWQASAGRTETFRASEVAKVKVQVEAALQGVPELMNSSNAQKQEFAEALLVQTALIEASMEQAAGDRSQIRAIGDAVRKGAEAMGLDLDGMTLTADGFVPTGKTGRVNESSQPKTPNSEDGRTVLSANDENDGNDVSNLTLIAAAGGAGLGAMILLGKLFSKRG